MALPISLLEDDAGEGWGRLEAASWREAPGAGHASRAAGRVIEMRGREADGAVDTIKRRRKRGLSPHRGI